MALGIRGFNPIWSEFDLQGNLFDDTFYLFVLENTIPYIPATVYHDPDLLTPWTQPIQFLGNGTLPVDIYFEPDVVYRLEFRQGPTQQYPLIYEVNNYIAGPGGSVPVDTVAVASSNQITNPQFAFVNFISPLILSGPKPDLIPLAPGWYLELEGSGTATINQVPLSSTNENPTNAPYALQLTLAGWTSVVLIQRFQQNGMLWANKTVSSAITARCEGAPQQIGAILRDSNNAPLATVLAFTTTINNDYNEFTGHGDLLATSNTDEPPLAYIDYRLTIPNNIDIYISSIQLIVQELPFEPTFIQDSVERQLDQTSHYFIPQLSYKPIPSYLVGWDFSTNPCQIFGTTVSTPSVGANKSFYAYDQTILFQTVNNALSSTCINSLQLTPALNTQAAVIQYLRAEDYKNLFIDLKLNQLSVNLRVGQTVNQTYTISLWWTAGTLPDMNSNDSLVTALDAVGHPTVAVGWNEIDRYNNQQATITTETTVAKDYGFNGWFDLDAVDTATYFAIVIGTDTILSGNTVDIISCSLVSGSIPTIPAPQAPDEVLRECEYYYEMSYGQGGLVATSVTANRLTRVMVPAISSPFGSGYGIIASPFGIEWKIPKRANPNFAIYSPITGTINTVTLSGTDAGAPHTNEITFGTFFTLASKSTKSADWTGLTAPGFMYATAVGLVNGSIKFHYTADARLGIV